MVELQSGEERMCLYYGLIHNTTHIVIFRVQQRNILGQESDGY